MGGNSSKSNGPRMPENNSFSATEKEFIAGGAATLGELAGGTGGAFVGYWAGKALTGPMERGMNDYARNFNSYRDQGYSERAAMDMADLTSPWAAGGGYTSYG